MKNILYIIVAIIPLLSIAQKQGNIWYFGLQLGLDFSNGTPIILTNGQTGTDIPNYIPQEGTSCISDSTGNILFYTGGQTIWNRNHLTMPNGTGIMGGASSTQSSLIVPLPESDSIFYVFTSDQYQSYINSPPDHKGYRYNVVDMCLDNGLGDVIEGQKNILLCDSSTEKLAACEDANGNGYWVVGHKMFSDEFYAWHLTSGGITDTVISKIGTIHGWHNSTSTWYSGAAQGQMKFNSSGDKLALAISNFDPAYLDLFDFNNNTGVVSNICHIVIDSALQKRIYGIEFSPNGTKLYASLTGGIGGSSLFQYDVTVYGNNCDSIIASHLIIFQSYTNNIYGIQLAPDKKIYVVFPNNFLGSINFPNLSGFAVNFDSLAVPFAPYEMLPSFIAGYKYHNGIVRCSSEGIGEIEKNNKIILYQNEPNPFGESTVIRYFIPENITTSTYIVFSDLYGKEINRIEIKDKGFGKIDADTENLTSGIYSYSLIINGNVIDTKKMIRN